MFTNLTKTQKFDLGKITISALLLILGVITKTHTISLGLYITSYLIIGYEVLLSALYNIKNGQVFDENFLMAIATIGALILREYTEAVFVMLFYQVGELFENLAVGKSRNSIKALLEYAPEEAVLLKDGKEQVLDPSDIKIGDTILVKVGEKIPLDGTIIEGKSSLNMAFLTGESIPVDVKEGDKVHSGSINQSGVLKIKVTSDFEDSTVSKILELIENSSQKKSVLENFITRFARFYTPLVVISALALAFLPPLILNQAFSIWIRRALIFLVVSCPCALVISVPLTFFGGIGKASKNGILIKGSNYLEAFSKVKTIVFDKTGTLTEGTFKITKEYSKKDSNWRDLAGSLESYSNHPVAKSIYQTFGGKHKDEIDQVEEIHGMGLVGKYKDMTLGVGNKKLMEKLKIKPIEINDIGTIIYVAIQEQLHGILVISDTIKEETHESLQDLKKLGIQNLILLTGDKKEVAEKVAKDLGITKHYSELLPKDKVEKFEEILKEKEAGTMVAFVGDGINDAPVLTRSDLGIAMGVLGSDAAIEAADIVLMDDKLKKLSLGKQIATQTVKIAKQNIALALIVKFLVLGLSIFGLATMWMAIFADVGVMVLAVINSMRTMK